MMRKLIVTADDLGAHEAINRGILEAHEEGIVTSASIVACGRAFDHACRLVEKRRKLDVGIHLTLVEERPLLGPDEIKHPGARSESCRRPIGSSSWGSSRASINLSDIEKELDAQIQKVLQAGPQRFPTSTPTSTPTCFHRCGPCSSASPRTTSSRVCPREFPHRPRAERSSASFSPLSQSEACSARPAKARDPAPPIRCGCRLRAVTSPAARSTEGIPETPGGRHRTRRPPRRRSEGPRDASIPIGDSSGSRNSRPSRPPMCVTRCFVRTFS